MFGLDPLTAGTLMVLAGVTATPTCPKVEPTKINVIPVTKDIQYDYKQSLAQIQSRQSDTIDPHDFHSLTMTQGFMDGQISVRRSMKMGSQGLTYVNATCLWYQSIDVTLEIDPKIVIAREVAQDPCMGKAVLEHEMKHIRTDRKIVNRYAREIGTKIFDALKERGYSSGPVRPEYAKQIADRMQKTIDQIIEHEYKKLDLDRVDEQRAVDNLEEYNRVGALCPAFKAKQEESMQKKKSSTLW